MTRLAICFGSVLPLVSLLAPTCGPGDPPNTTCNTTYTSSVGDCTEWLTGPASPNRDATFGTDGLRKVWSTDQGWAVPTPDGSDLRLMAYGDSFWMDETYRDCVLYGCKSSRCIPSAYEDLCPLHPTPEHPLWKGCVNTTIPDDPALALAACESACTYFKPVEEQEARRNCYETCSEDAPGAKELFCNERCTFDSLTEPFEECYALCLGTDCSSACSWDKKCIDICTGLLPSALPHRDMDSLCRYWSEEAPGVKHLSADFGGCPGESKSTLRNQVVFFEAEVVRTDTNPYNIDLGSQVMDRRVLHNDAEKAKQCADLAVGVYTLDYFYACPLNDPDTDCADADRKLFFLTGTTCWNCASTGRPEEAARISGTGIYYYDYPADPGGDASAYPYGFRAIYESLGAGVRPPSPYPGITIENPEVLWGYGTKMQHARVFRDYRDPYDPDRASGVRYIYFIGTEGLASPVYLARVEARADAILAGDFQYLLGVVESSIPPFRESQWGAYDEDGLHPLEGIANAPSSIIKQGSLYWMASMISTGEPPGTEPHRNGLAVAYSANGHHWTLAPNSPDYATAIPMPGFVYGYSWVPPVVIRKSRALPVAFSVWKSYEGYFDDYFWTYPGAELDPIDEDEQFREYNTKMYWYNTWWLRPFRMLDYMYRYRLPPMTDDPEPPPFGTMELPFNAWAMYDDNQNSHVVIEFCECGFNDDAETCRKMRCDPTIPMIAGDEVYSRGQLIPNPWKAPLLENGTILDRVKFAPGQDGTGVPYVPKWLWLEQIGAKSANVILRFSYWQNEKDMAGELRENLRANPDTFCDQCYTGQLTYGDPACTICWLKADTAFQTTDILSFSNSQQE